MNALPPLYRDQRKIDADHLRLLVLFHYIGAALSGVGLLFVAGHFTFLRLILAHVPPPAGHARGPGPEQVFHVLIWFYLALALWFVLSGVGDLVSARCIRARRHRTFSLLVAGLNCLHTPIGIMLGVFTMVVLVRDSVREVYDAGAAGGSAPGRLPASAPPPASIPVSAAPPPVAAPPPMPPAAPPIPPPAEQGDATGGIIPYKNPHALTAYYLGVFSLIPVLGFFLGAAAVPLGISGLRAHARRPMIRGVVHAWVGIVGGSLSVAAHLAAVAIPLLHLLPRHH
jgi:hypothetical protein